MKNSYKDGHALNSKNWEDNKKGIGDLPPKEYEESIGCMLGDACMYRVSKDAK